MMEVAIKNVYGYPSNLAADDNCVQLDVAEEYSYRTPFDYSSSLLLDQRLNLYATAAITRNTLNTVVMREAVKLYPFVFER